jgi:hypothetical protein
MPNKRKMAPIRRLTVTQASRIPRRGTFDSLLLSPFGYVKPNPKLIKKIADLEKSKKKHASSGVRNGETRSGIDNAGIVVANASELDHGDEDVPFEQWDGITHFGAEPTANAQTRNKQARQWIDVTIPQLVIVWRELQRKTNNLRNIQNLPKAGICSCGKRKLNVLCVSLQCA